MGLLSWIFGKRGISDKAEPQVPRKIGRESIAKVRWRDGSFPMDAVGESNYQNALRRICGGHTRHGHDLETDAILVREPLNPHDSSAVVVTIDGDTVGYLPRAQAARVSTQMIEDGIDQAACRAKIVGGWRTNQHDEGSFGVRLAIPNQGWIDFGVGNRPSTPPAQSRRKSAPKRPKAAATGPLKGHFIVIWGDAAEGAVARELAALGAHIMAGVGKSTTMVVQIENEMSPGMETSSTYTKAQERIAAGARLEVVTLKSLRSRISKLS